MSARRAARSGLLAAVLLIALAAVLWAASPPPCTAGGSVGGITPTAGQIVHGNIQVSAAGGEWVSAGTCSKLYEFAYEAWSTTDPPPDEEPVTDCYWSQTRVRVEGCGSSGAWGLGGYWASYPNGGHHSYGRLWKREYKYPPGGPWYFVSGKTAGYTVRN